MNRRTKIGVVGLGYWGPNLVRNLRSLPDCSLTTVCDTNKQRLQHLRALYPGIAGETDYKQLLNGSGLDAIVIATSVHLHYPMAKASLLAGKHTLIEKPMASSAAQCEELIEIDHDDVDLVEVRNDRAVLTHARQAKYGQRMRILIVRPRRGGRHRRKDPVRESTCEAAR